MSRKKKSVYPYRPKTKSSFMYPNLHQDLLDALSGSIDPPTFLESEKQSCNQYNTHVMGTFAYINGHCAEQGWISKKVAIQIRSYPFNRYNARLFNQRCCTCGRLGAFTLDQQSYLDRLTYRLKKWAGAPVEQPPHSTKKTKPHKSELCEGCKIGLCQETKD